MKVDKSSGPNLIYPRLIREAKENIENMKMLCSLIKLINFRLLPLSVETLKEVIWQGCGRGWIMIPWKQVRVHSYFPHGQREAELLWKMNPEN